MDVKSNKICYLLGLNVPDKADVNHIHPLHMGLEIWCGDTNTCQTCSREIQVRFWYPGVHLPDAGPDQQESNLLEEHVAPADPESVKFGKLS